LRNRYDVDVFWIKLGRMLLVGLAALVVLTVLAGPAVGWYVDTRIFPGQPDTVVQLFDAQHHLVDSYRNTRDTYSTTLWLYVPYSIELAALLVVGVIFTVKRIDRAKKQLNLNESGMMSNIFDPIPTKRPELERGLERDRTLY